MELFIIAIVVAIGLVIIVATIMSPNHKRLEEEYRKLINFEEYRKKNPDLVGDYAIRCAECGSKKFNEDSLLKNDKEKYLFRKCTDCNARLFKYKKI